MNFQTEDLICWVKGAASFPGSEPILINLQMPSNVFFLTFYFYVILFGEFCCSALLFSSVVKMQVIAGSCISQN